MIDNHTSNGADYQYVMTLIATQKDKLHPTLSAHMTSTMLPALYEKMENKGYEMTPYVYVRNTPDAGISGFLDLPRYSSGYAALHHCYSFMPETHMLKPFKDRVKSTYLFSLSMLEYMSIHGDDIMHSRAAAKKDYAEKKQVDINWSMDNTAVDSLNFKGYEAKYKKSLVTGQDRLYYDRSSPYEKQVPFYNTYKSSATVEKPRAYIIPQAYYKIIDRLKWNGVELSIVDTEKTMQVQAYYIEDYKSPGSPYEGHYLHRQVEVSVRNIEVETRPGDVIVYTGQEKDRYIMEVLEPQAPDSYFAWNFMDGILMQKEHFSSYVFEDRAAELLKNNAELRTAFNKKKEEDAAFSENARAQLNFIYEQSPHYEQTYRRYPVFLLK